MEPKFTKEDIKEYNERIEQDDRSDLLYQKRFLYSEELINFYLSILNNTNEYDLCRIEATKNIRDHYEEIPSNKKLLNSVIDSVIHIILYDLDDDVRCYAAMALSVFEQYRPLGTVLKDIMLNPNEDKNLRACVFDIIRKQKHTAECKEILTILMNDRDYKKSAKRVLSE